MRNERFLTLEINDPFTILLNEIIIVLGLVPLKRFSIPQKMFNIKLDIFSNLLEIPHSL